MTITITNLSKNAPCTISLKQAHDGFPASVRTHPDTVEVEGGGAGVVLREREIFASLMLAPGEKREGLPPSMASDPAIVAAKKRRFIDVKG